MQEQTQDFRPQESNLATIAWTVGALAVVLVIAVYMGMTS
jgi:hypothetical protein